MFEEEHEVEIQPAKKGNGLREVTPQLHTELFRKRHGNKYTASNIINAHTSANVQTSN